MIIKNEAFDLPVYFGVTLLTPTCEISKEGGLFAAIAGTVSEIENGWYLVEFTAGDMNANSIAVVVSAAAQDDIMFTIETDTEDTTLTAQDVWEYATRTLSDGANIAEDVWEYVTRTLTANPGISAADVWSYVTRELTSGGSITPQDVWEYATRELTDKTDFELTAAYDAAKTAAQADVTALEETSQLILETMTALPTLAITTQVLDSGELFIIRGNSYGIEGSYPAILFTNEGGGWPDLTDLTITFESGSVSVECTLDTDTIELTLSSTESEALETGKYYIWAEIDELGNRACLVNGAIYVDEVI